MGFGMSRIMHGTPSQTDIVVGMICGIIGLLICVFNYPVYSYLNKYDKIFAKIINNENIKHK